MKNNSTICTLSSSPNSSLKSVIAVNNTSSKKTKNRVSMSQENPRHWSNSGTINLETLSHLLGKTDGPRFVQYLKSLRVSETLPLLDFHLYIPKELIKNFSTFCEKLNTFSQVGRTFSAIREDNFIKIDIFTFKDNLSLPKLSNQSNLEITPTFLDPNNSLRIYSGEIAITSADSPQYVLHTVNERPQVKMIIYNSTQKIAAIAHIPNYKAQREIMQYLLQKIASPMDHIQITLSASSTTPKIFSSYVNKGIVSMQARYKNMRGTIKKDYTLLAINAKTGEIQSNFGFINLGNRTTNLLPEKIFSGVAKINLHLIFDGRISRLIANPLLTTENFPNNDVGLPHILPSFEKNKRAIRTQTSPENTCGEILMQLRNSC